MKNNSNSIPIDDREDGGSDDDIAIIRKQNKIEKKKKAKTNHISIPKDQQQQQQSTSQIYHEIKDEEIEFVEFVLGDFPKLNDLNKFKQMTSLSLVNENVLSIESIVENIPVCNNITFLCLNENQISSLKGIDKLLNLKELYLSFNNIETIHPCIIELKQLDKLWLCENQLSKFEDYPITLKELWLANNSIESIPVTIDKYINLETLNLGGNLITDFQDIYHLQHLPKLAKLYLTDINFGDNPICQYNQYRVLLLHFLPSLTNLDQINITDEEKKDVENYYIKKNLYYKTKVRNTHKITKLMIQMLNRNKLFFNQWKMLQCSFFTKRYEMLQFAHYEINSLGVKSETSLEDIATEINSSLEKVKLCHNAIDIIEENYLFIKNYLKELNDISIVINFYEMESGGNFKIEPGNTNQKWTKSCLDLIKSKMTPTFIERNMIKTVTFNKVFKIINKKSKIIFDSLYDNIIETNGKFGDDKKHFDFYFLIFDHKDFHSILSFLFEDKNISANNDSINHEKDMNLYLTDNLSLIDEIQLKNNIHHFSAIICKCAVFDSIIEKGASYPSNTFSDIKSIIKALNSDKSSQEKQVLKVTIGDNAYYNYKIKGLLIPEYLIEYDYITTANPGKGFVSSFTTTVDLEEDYYNLFNQCSKELFNDDMKFYDDEYVQKYSLLKMAEFDELDNSMFFFVKNSILSFIAKCFKYPCYTDFQAEFNKIKDRLKEILDKKFHTDLMTKLGSVEICENEIFNTLTCINLFNCNMNNQSLKGFLNKIQKNDQAKQNIIYISCTHNDIDVLEFGMILNQFPNLLGIDFSTNLIHSIHFKLSEENEESETNDNIIKENNTLEKVCLSFNKFTNIKPILNVISVCKNIKCLAYYGNPLLKYFLRIDQLRYDYNSAISTKDDKIALLKQSYLKYEEEQNTQIKPIEISKDMCELKTNRIAFDLLFDSYSFYDKYRVFSSSKYFKEQMSKETNKQSLILSKRKLKYIPLIENQENTQIFWINLNKISHISNLDKFAKLQELYIQNNKIKVIDNLPLTLLKLDLSNNLLESLNGIAKTPNLTWLNVENNMITTINDIIILEKLIEFHSAQNYIWNIKECYLLKQLPLIEIIDISGNDVCRNVHEIRLGMIFYCQRLKNFNKINIDEIERGKAFEYFEGRLTDGILENKLGVNYDTKGLIELDLSSLKLKDSEGIFSNENYQKLTKLNLSRNLFKSFAIFGYLPTLIELNLNYNIIVEIKPKLKIKQGNAQRGLNGLPNLQSLEMAGNGLSNLVGIQIMTNLKSLVLRENNIAKIESLTTMKYLSFLDLSFNKLRTVDKSNLGILPCLQILLVDNNYLRNINAFSKFESVQTLSFDNNKIADSQSLMKLIELPQLRDLCLINNPVERINNYRTTMLNLFTNLYKLDNIEITSEEREMIFIEMQMGEYAEDDYNKVYFYPPSMNNRNNINNHNGVAGVNAYALQKMQDKARVKFINLDFFSQNPMTSPKNPNILPQIKPYGFPCRDKPPTSDSKRLPKSSTSHKYGNNQVKVNALMMNNNNSNSNNSKKASNISRDYISNPNVSTQMQYLNPNDYFFQSKPNKK